MGTRRALFLGLGTLGACLTAGALAVYLFRRDLWPPPPPPLPSPPAARAQPPAQPSPPDAPTFPVAAPRSHVVSWAGLSVARCESDLRYDLMVRPALDRLDQDLLDAVKDLKDSSGLFPVAEDRMALVPVSRREATFQDAYAVTLTGAGAKAELPIEPLVLGWWPARSVVASALAEAVLLQEAPRYADAPAWLRHGVALHLSRFGPVYADRAILESALPPPQLVRSLAESGNLSWLDGYWAVKALSARAGDESVKRWLQLMFEGKSWGEALEAAANETPLVFEERYKAWALAHLRDRCVNRQELLDAVARLRIQKEAEAIPDLEAFVKNRPLDLCVGNAKYFLNYARFREGEYEAAINGFTDLLTNAPASTTWQGKAHYFLGRSYQLAGYRPLAVKEFMLASLEPDSDLLRKLAKEHLAEVE